MEQKGRAPPGPEQARKLGRDRRELGKQRFSGVFQDGSGKWLKMTIFRAITEAKSMNGRLAFMNGELALMNGETAFMSRRLSFMDGEAAFVSKGLPFMDGGLAFMNKAAVLTNAEAASMSGRVAFLRAGHGIAGFRSKSWILLLYSIVMKKIERRIEPAV